MHLQLKRKIAFALLKGLREIRLTVEDNGVGVDPNTSDRLFNAFYTTKDHGMGIGLSVSRSIIKRHDGRICAHPESEDITASLTYPFYICARHDPIGRVTKWRCLAGRKGLLKRNSSHWCSECPALRSSMPPYRSALASIPGRPAACN